MSNSTNRSIEELTALELTAGTKDMLEHMEETDSTMMKVLDQIRVTPVVLVKAPLFLIIEQLEVFTRTGQRIMVENRIQLLRLKINRNPMRALAYLNEIKAGGAPALARFVNQFTVGGYSILKEQAKEAEAALNQMANAKEPAKNKVEITSSVDVSETPVSEDVKVEHHYLHPRGTKNTMHVKALKDSLKQAEDSTEELRKLCAAAEREEANRLKSETVPIDQI